MGSLPRSRKATSDPPGPDEISKLLLANWGFTPTHIHRLGSRCVHLIVAPDWSVVLRANPGWDGPSDPSLVVRFVDYLSSAGAPAPAIFPTMQGDLSMPFRDYTISLEAVLPGRPLDSSRLDVLESVGRTCSNPFYRGLFPRGTRPRNASERIRRQGNGRLRKSAGWERGQGG